MCQRLLLLCVGALVCSGGCLRPSAPPPAPPPMERIALQRQAFECLTRAIQYKPNPAIRAEAVEALDSCGRQEGKPWVRSALRDQHAAVRFAACVSAGRRRDALARSGLLACLDDEDASVRAAAIFAMHALGDDTHTGELATYLLEHEDVAVRRNTALVLGLFEQPGVVKLLARAMRDPDAGVQQHALEAMARLENPESLQQLKFIANSGVGSEEVMAINALIEAGDRTSADLFRYKMGMAAHIETRLAAARGLGLLGFADGLELALGAAAFTRATRQEQDDPPAAQILRTRQLAMGALGAIGKPEALPVLDLILNDPADPRLQVAAAKAILEIIDRQKRDVPWVAPVPAGSD